jgi:hypothetical protein
MHSHIPFLEQNTFAAHDSLLWDRQNYKLRTTNRIFIYQKCSQKETVLEKLVRKFIA